MDRRMCRNRLCDEPDSHICRFHICLSAGGRLELFLENAFGLGGYPFPAGGSEGSGCGGGGSLYELAGDLFQYLSDVPAARNMGRTFLRGGAFSHVRSDYLCDTLFSLLCSEGDRQKLPDDFLHGCVVADGTGNSL